jgi:enoyl-CoA hydratase/carnithine racemase
MATLQSALVVASTPVPNVRVIAFNRSDKRNALSQALIAEFLKELSLASYDADVNTIVITGSSSFFSGA